MEVIHSGHGPHSKAWLDLIERDSALRSVAFIGETDGLDISQIRQYRTLEEALSGGSADLAISAGAQAVSRAAEALEAGLWVVLDEPGEADLPAVEVLAAKAAATPRLLTDLFPYCYARCEGLVRFFLGGGRLGDLGHIACMDHRAGPENDQLSRYAYRHFVDICKLLRQDPGAIRARLRSGSQGWSTTEAFIDMTSGHRIHYFGATDAVSDAHSLWIEGTKGSLRTDGARVWWRKRGWPLFLPIRIALSGPPGSGVPRRAPRDIRRVAKSGRSAGGRGDLRGIVLAAAARESNRTGAAVTLPPAVHV